jgi:TolB-like protein/DNA-binding winged helix-turn-helix (wHTH) protein/Flp pilus assembly protein TadD
MRFSFGEYQLDTEARSLQRSGQAIHVEPKVFDLLAYLIEHRERVATPDELLEALWPGAQVGPAALSNAVRKLREAVGDDGDRQAVVRTKHGHGFQFVAEVSVLSDVEGAAEAPTGFRSRWVATAGVVALLLAVAAVWFVNRPVAELAPARSVAVLPFANISQDAAAVPFTNGIYDDILTRISKIRDLKVIARTTMERLDPNLSAQEIGTMLGVAAVLEGGVQRAGDRIRINVQLIDCETEAHLWAETYDRELTTENIFAIQSEIAMTVADALQAELSPGEQDRIATVPTDNLAAYQTYLLGHQRLSKFTNAATSEAAGYFQQATELDPSYALAYVGLADTYVRQARWGGLPFMETLAKAQFMAENALALDDQLGEAHASLALIKDVRGNFEGAERVYRRALELSPNYAKAYDWFGIFLREKLDRTEEALAMQLRAAELDPLSPRILTTVGVSLESQGRFEEAFAWYERAYELDPMQDYVNGAIGRYQWSVLGRLDQAVVWFRRAAFIDPDYPGLNIPLGEVFLDLGDPGRAAFWIERSIELNPRWSRGMGALSLLHLYRGDEVAAVNQARKVLAASPHDWWSLSRLRNHELSAGRYAEARALYEEIHPELLSDDDPQVGRTNWVPAIDLALVLFNTGEKERADLLLEKSLLHIQNQSRFGNNGYRLMDVEIFALQGEKQKALSTLRQAIDDDWRRYWWYSFEHEPNLGSLRGEPEFQAMKEEIQADMAAQLAQVQEMEQAGELAAIPRDETALH